MQNNMNRLNDNKETQKKEEKKTSVCRNMQNNNRNTENISKKMLNDYK